MRKKTLVAALAVAAAIGMALTGCSGGGSAGTGTSAATGSTASGPDDLKIGNFLDVTSWDPSLADIGFDGPYLSAVYDALIALDKNGNPIPSLATKFTVASNRLSVTLDIKQGVKFSDGEPVNAAAVVKSLQYLQKGARSGEAYTHVKDFIAVNDDTVRIDLTQRDDTMLYLMGLGRSYVMAPKAIDAGTLAKHPVGSGPYTLDSSSVAGSEYRFTKVKNYWDAKDYPFSSLVIYPILDATARNNAMLSGQINVNYGDITNVDQATQQGWNVAKRVGMWAGIEFTDHTGAKLAPLGKVQVRQALNVAFDAAGILKAVGNGAGVQTNQVWPDGSKVNDPALNGMYTFDIAKAKKLLAEGGYPNGFTVTMPMSPIFQQWQPSVEQTFKQLGIKVTWNNMQQPDYQISAPNYPMFVAAIALDGNDVATMQRQVTEKQWYNPNPDYAKFPEVKALVDAATTATGSAQTTAIKALNKKLTQLAWFSTWYQSENLYYSVKGIKVQPIVGMMFPTLRYITKS